ncbi:hypothetical protein SS50377_21041 [Spironucleus salmonicida]|uniref:Uncharacterized protein n=1 Tax=Spironucleus salmonicida TaxID=348837 RepID=A0A9P8S2H4_9EUKA|nr:hypothetical protein SS50377_21041 [Spironucleus salmonicida]
MNQILQYYQLHQILYIPSITQKCKSCQLLTNQLQELTHPKVCNIKLKFKIYKKYEMCGKDTLQRKQIFILIKKQKSLRRVVERQNARYVIDQTAVFLENLIWKNQDYEESEEQQDLRKLFPGLF